MSDVLLETMRERDTLRTAIDEVLALPVGDGQADAMVAVLAAATGGAAPMPGVPPAEWHGEILTIPPNALAPFDRLADGRYVRALQGAVGGDWTQMDVGQVTAEHQVVEMIGGAHVCIWGPAWSDLERIPVPRELTISRGGPMPGYTCTAPGRPDECATCPARP